MLNSNNFRDMYATIGINIDKLGCIMLDVDGSKIPMPPEENMYVTTHPDRFWIQGFVGGKHPHITLLYGLMKSGKTEWKDQIDKVLEGWEMKSVLIEQISYFDSPYEDEPYYCIIAHVRITPELMEGHKRLEFLPHINTFPQYKAHITLAYVKKDEDIREEMINFFAAHLYGENEIPVLGLNYGK